MNDLDVDKSRMVQMTLLTNTLQRNHRVVYELDLEEILRL